MKVILKYHDHESFTIDEIVRQAKHNYGNVGVEVYPESNSADDILYFAIQQLISHEQISLLFDSKGSYHVDIKKLRSEILYKIEQVLNEVILDNETKVSGE
jgi:hypothetical protein